MNSIHREILRLSLPSILANITVPLVGMVDIAIAGHLGAREGFAAAALIGGITIGTMLFDLLYWNFAFLRTGTGGLTAQAYGRSDMGGASATLTRALRISLLSGVALILLQWAVVWLAFLLVECSPEVQELATRYFRIRIFAAPATLSLFAFKGWFIGMQDSVRPMTCDLLVNGMNIVASTALAFGGMGFSGIALGTVIAQWIGFIYAALAVKFRYGNIFKEKGTVPEGDFFALNRDLILRALGMIAVYIGFTVISARYGDVLLAVSAIIMKLLMIFSYFTDGFAYAGEALSGRFIGAADVTGFRRAVRGCFVWGGGVGLLFILLYGFGGMPAFRLMTSDPGVVDAGREFLPWLMLMPLIGCPAFVWDGIFIGATASTDLRNSTLLCAVGFFAVWFAGLYAFRPEGSAAIHLLMAAYFMHLAIRTVYLSLKYKSIIPKCPCSVTSE